MIWEIVTKPTMTKADLIEEVCRVVEIPRREAELVVETMLRSMVEALRAGDKVEIRGFGRFDWGGSFPSFALLDSPVDL